MKIDRLDLQIRNITEQIKSLSDQEKLLKKIKPRIKDVEVKLNLNEDLDKDEVNFLQDQSNRLKMQFADSERLLNKQNKLKSEIISLKTKRNELKMEEEKILKKFLSVILKNKTELEQLNFDSRLSKEDAEILSSNIRKIEELFNLDRPGKINYFIPYFLAFAKKEGNEIDLNFLKATSAGLHGEETRIVPQNVIDFIISYLKDGEYENILDPWAKNGTLLVPIWQTKIKMKAFGVVEDPKNVETLDLLYEGLNIKWESMNIKNFEPESFDLIVGFPKWGPLAPSDHFFPNPQFRDRYRNHLKKIELINVLNLLNNRGIAFLLLPTWILSWECKSELIFDLKKNGIYIDAIIEMPNMDSAIEMSDGEHTFGTSFSNDGLLMIFKRENQDLFVAELSKDMNINKEVILDNLLNRKSGKIPQMGFITSLEDYSSLRSLTAKIETQKLALNAGLKSIPTSEIIEKITISDTPEKSEIDKIVYLPFNSELLSAVSFEDLEEPKLFHAQLFLDTKKAFPEYLKNFFNSEMGYKFRETWINQDLTFLKGRTLDFKDNVFDSDQSFQDFFNNLNSNFEEMVMNSEMYLPDLREQMNTVEVNDMISELDQQISDYRVKLWKWPLKNDEIKKSVELLKVGNRFDYWIDSLPYPLSSILLSCSADSNIEHRLRYVLHFFEALTEFNFSIILSALNNDKNLIKEFAGCLQDSKYPKWYYKPTFGNWNFLGNCLAKKLRIMLNESEKDQIYKAFGNPNPKFFKIVTSKKLYNILMEAAEYRNKWIGHGPPVSDEENRRRLKILGSLISKTNQTISHNYDGSLLAQPIPGTMSYDEGIFSTKIKVLKGRLPFKDYTIETIHPLDNKKIYLFHENQYEALELLPFFKIMESPKTEHNACYFYNRYECKEHGKEISLISYHFDKESEIPGSYDEYKLLFSIFNSDDYKS